VVVNCVTIYTRKGCHLCEQVEAIVRYVQRRRSFTLELLDIDADPALRGLYNEAVPVVAIDGKEAFRYGISAEEFERRLAAAG
jgi:glutaredoxin